jgi:hypothetical protein
MSVSALGQDPCDAIWHFAFFVMIFTLAVSTVSTFRLYCGEPALTVHAIRAQQAFVLALFTALAADIVALTRNPSMWINAGYRNHLLAALGVLAAVAVAMQLLIRAQITRPATESPALEASDISVPTRLNVVNFLPRVRNRYQLDNCAHPHRRPRRTHIVCLAALLAAGARAL